MRKFSVIIAHLNNFGELYYTLWDLFKELNGFEYEIIIVDNGSEVGQLLAIKQYLMRIELFHKVKLFIYDEYQGTVPPWQFGVSKAEGKYLVFIDSHVTLSSDYFRIQNEVLENDPEIKVLYSSSCFVGYGKDKSNHYKFDKKNLQLAFAEDIDDKEELFEPLVSQMGCVIVEREHFVKIGMFGDCFLKYGGYGAEELILGIKTKMFGGKTVFNKHVFFHHSVLQKMGGKKLKLQNKAIAAYLLDGEDYMEKVLKNQPDYNPSFDNLLKEIPQLAERDRNLFLTAPVTYRELLKKYGLVE